MNKEEYDNLLKNAIIKVPSYQYQKTDSDSKNIYSYQYISKQLNLDSFYIFVVAVLIGKYIVDPNDIPKKLPKEKETYTRLSYYNYSGKGIEMLKAIAIEDTGNINILKYPSEMVRIWELYAMAGFDMLQSWYHDSSVDLDSKLDDILTEFNKKNMKSINKK